MIVRHVKKGSTSERISPRGRSSRGRITRLKAITLAAHNKFAHPKPEATPVDDTECIHGMEFGCSICSGKDSKRLEPEEIDFSYRAKYDGQCPGCNLPIAPGQQCVKTTKGRNLHTTACERHPALNPGHSAPN